LSPHPTDLNRAKKQKKGLTHILVLIIIIDISIERGPANLAQKTGFFE